MAKAAKPALEPVTEVPPYNYGAERCPEVKIDSNVLQEATWAAAEATMETADGWPVGVRLSMLANELAPLSQRVSILLSHATVAALRSGRRCVVLTQANRWVELVPCGSLMRVEGPNEAERQQHFNHVEQLLLSVGEFHLAQGLTFEQLTPRGMR